MLASDALTKISLKDTWRKMVCLGGTKLIEIAKEEASRIFASTNGISTGAVPL